MSTVSIVTKGSDIINRLVPKSVTLNDLERRNGRVVCVISPNSIAFVANYVKVVDWPSTDFLPRNGIKYTN